MFLKVFETTGGSNVFRCTQSRRKEHHVCANDVICVRKRDLFSHLHNLLPWWSLSVGMMSLADENGTHVVCIWH